MAPGFGIGALEELDVEDEDVYAGKNRFAISLIMVVFRYKHTYLCFSDSRGSKPLSVKVN